MTAQNIEDIVYRTVDGIELLGRLYRPDGGGYGIWLIDVHGGACGFGDRLNYEIIHLNLQANGVGAFALDFRLSDVARYPAPVEDVAYGIRWFKANAQRLGLTVKKLGALASSSGAQQMGLIALKPDDPRWTVKDATLGDADASVEFLVAGWPILDPLARYKMVQEAGNERIMSAHHAYFADEAAMADGNPYMLLERGEATHLPPVLIVQGTNDANVAHERADIFAALYREKGGDAEVIKYEGMPHTFVTNEPEANLSEKAIADIRAFVLGR